MGDLSCGATAVAYSTNRTWETVPGAASATRTPALSGDSALAYLALLVSSIKLSISTAIDNGGAKYRILFASIRRDGYRAVRIDIRCDETR